MAYWLGGVPSVATIMSPERQPRFQENEWKLTLTGAVLDGIARAVQRVAVFGVQPPRAPIGANSSLTSAIL